MDDRRKTLISIGIGAALLLMATLPYAQTMWHGFVVYDDNLYITDNTIVLRGVTWNGLRWAFTTLHASNWHPLTWLSHMLDCTLFRRPDGTQWPGGHHLVNVLLHGVNTLLLWIVLRSLTGTIWRSALVAALFAVHPLHTESVAWIAERKDVLSTFFGLLAIWCYAGWVRRRSVLAYLLMLGWFAMSLMAKPMLVTLPCVLLLLDVWPLGRIGGLRCLPSVENEFAKADSRKGRHTSKVKSESGPARPTSLVMVFAEKIPLVILAAASSVMTLYAQQSGGAVFTLDALPAGARVGNAIVSCATYLLKTIWPLDLSLLYPLPVGGYWPAWRVMGSVVILGVVIVVVAVLSRKRPALLVGWLWFLGTLVPVIGLVQVGMQSMADRYTYVPLVGVFIMIAWCLPAASPGWRRVSVVTAFLMLTFFTIVACIQIRYWRDDFTLFGRTLKVTSNNFIAHNNLGHAYAKMNQLDSAIREFNQAITIKSDYAAAHENLGSVLVRGGRANEAVQHLETALQRQPNSVRILSSLGAALDAAGRLDEAVATYRRALDIDANAAEVHASLGLALARQSRTSDAIAEYQIALRLNPDDARVHAKLGLALASEGRLDEAIVQFQEALRLEPDFVQAREYLNVALDQKSQGSLNQ